MTFVQIQSLARANDPVYELEFRFVGAKMQEKIWHHVLTSLAAHFQMATVVEMTRTCVDPHLQWSQIGHVRHNAQMRTLIYTATSPVRNWFGRKTN